MNERIKNMRILILFGLSEAMETSNSVKKIRSLEKIVFNLIKLSNLNGIDNYNEQLLKGYADQLTAPVSKHEILEIINHLHKQQL